VRQLAKLFKKPNYGTTKACQMADISAFNFLQGLQMDPKIFSRSLSTLTGSNVLSSREGTFGALKGSLNTLTDSDVLTNHKDTQPYKLRKIWEINPQLKCPLVGACCTLEEHRRLLKKCGVAIKGMNNHDLHSHVMMSMEGKNHISLKVDRYLKHKYSKSLNTFVEMEEKAFMKAWYSHFESGEMAGIFYVAAVRTDLSDNALLAIFGQVHMLGHANLAEVMFSRRKCKQLTAIAEKTAKVLNRHKRRNKNLQKKIDHLSDQLKVLQNFFANPVCPEINKPAQKCSSCQCFKSENRELQQHLLELESLYNREQTAYQIIKQEKQRIKIDYAKLKSANEQLADELKDMINYFASQIICPEPCNKEQSPQFQLCTRRVLIVGGITKMKHFYRELVEASGGVLVYHDGYLHAGKQGLKECVKRCDMVICPVNCNSHGACKTVKTVCKNLKKPLKMLPRASLSTISNALIENDGTCVENYN